MQVSPDSHVEPLLDREKSSYWGHPFGVSTVAFCKGDVDACLAQLKIRFRPVPATQLRQKKGRGTPFPTFLLLPHGPNMDPIQFLR